MDATPGPAGSQFNPFLLPDTPTRPKLKIFGGSLSPANQPTRPGANLQAVRSRISTLEASSARRSSSSLTAEPSSARGPRAILALEASLLEMRTAHAAGPTLRIPHRRDENAGSERARRRDEARRLRRVSNLLGRGSRYERVVPLRHQDLWKERRGPPEQAAAREHHKCGICHSVKSHPVSYECGHGHCYVCIRLWLERSWKCPECVTVMYHAPFRVFAEEAWIADTYPNWSDNTVVDYNWDGLIFPKKPEVVVGDDE
ncbi:hypothetical protein B0H13DRAFT_2306519 [Mycena leptocephala]|nr:hypothetical protein B0H13DRAFT_2306519 [Mycena leptocephala]